MGSGASTIARAWFEDSRYQDYLYLHGLSVEMAEYLHNCRCERPLGREAVTQHATFQHRVPRHSQNMIRRPKEVGDA